MGKFLKLCTAHMVLLAVFLLAGARPAMAQGAKVDAFAGGSFLRDSSTFSGWNASVTGNALSWLGVTGDFSGHYNNGFHIMTYTFGPRLAFPSDSALVPFTQATFGVARLSAGAAHANGFAGYLGGGLDWYATEHVGIRFMQLDAQLTRVSGVNNTATRISFGVVFRLEAAERP